MEVIRDELLVIKNQYGDARRTEIYAGRVDLSREDLIAQETVVVTLSHAGYVKAQPLADYRAQRRGGKGRSSGRMREEDFVDRLVVANTHDTILCFSNRGKAYWLKVYDLPQTGHGAQGRPIVNFLPLSEGEKLTTILPLPAFEEGKSVFMATSDGTVKKTPLADFPGRARAGSWPSISSRGTSWSGPVSRADKAIFSCSAMAVRRSVSVSRTCVPWVVTPGACAA